MSLCCDGFVTMALQSFFLSSSLLYVLFFIACTIYLLVTWGVGAMSECGRGEISRVVAAADAASPGGGAGGVLAVLVGSPFLPNGEDAQGI